MRVSRRLRPSLPPLFAFTGFRFPPEVIGVAVRWYLRHGLSYRDAEELLAKRGVEVDHVTAYREHAVERPHLPPIVLAGRASHASTLRMRRPIRTAGGWS